MSTGFATLTAQLHETDKEPTTSNAPATTEGEPQEPEVRVLTPEEELLRAELERKARTYVKEFPVKLAEFNDPERYPFSDMDAEELQTTIDLMRQSLGLANSIGLFREGATKLVAVTEMIATKYTPIRAQGLTAVLASNEEWTDCVKELALEYGGLKYIPAKYRLAMITGHAMLQLHMINSVTPPPKVDSNIKKELEEKFKEF